MNVSVPLLLKDLFFFEHIQYDIYGSEDSDHERDEEISDPITHLWSMKSLRIHSIDSNR